MTGREKRYVLAGLILAAILGAVFGYLYGQARLRRWLIPEGGRECIDFQDAPQHIGEAGCVDGKILDVYTSGRGNTFLDFCVDYRKCPFTAVIFSEDRDKFGNLSALLGRRVEITGLVEFYKERAEIKIRDPVQIRIRP